MTLATGSTQRRRRCGIASLIAVMVVVGCAGTARAAAGSASFEEANRAYVQGRYPAAIAAFETLVRTRGWSAPLLYDLANAYAQEGNVGRAVLSYERARLLAPRDSDIAANLALIRTTAGLPLPARPWYRAFARLLSSLAWSVLAAGGLLLAAVAFAAARRLRSRRFAYVAVVAALAGVMCVAAVAILDRELDAAVVVAHKSAPLRLSPFDTAAVEATVGEGEEVAVIGRHGDFVRVRDGQGRAGWVQSSAVQLIVPRPS
jgi:SH3-like domain-containing protein